MFYRTGFVAHLPFLVPIHAVHTEVVREGIQPTRKLGTSLETFQFNEKHQENVLGKVFSLVFRACKAVTLVIYHLCIPVIENPKEHRIVVFGDPFH